MLHRTLLAVALLSLGCGDDDRRAPDGSLAPDLGRADMGADGGLATDAGAMDGGDDAGSELGDAGDDAGTRPTDAGPGSDADLFACVDAPLTLGSERNATTIGGPDVRNPNGSDCVGAIASGPERVFIFTAPDTGDYRITVTPGSATFDPMIYVQERCDDSAPCVAGTRLQGPGSADITTVSITGGRSVLVTVDTDLGGGGDPGGGPFTISVERAP